MVKIKLIHVKNDVWEYEPIVLDFIGSFNTVFFQMFDEFSFIIIILMYEIACADWIGIARPDERRSHPVETTVHLSRAARRLLGPTGAVAATVPVLAEEANAAAYKLWQSCANKQIIVWLDNWYRKRFGSDPLSNDMSLNLSVLAVLHTTDLPLFPGHLRFRQILEEVPALATRLVETFARVLKGVKIILQEDLQPQWIRVPLDVQRTGMRSLQWQPYLLTEQTVSSQPDLLAILKELGPLQVQTRSVMPLLVDMDIHYRIMKIMYGQSTSTWNFGAFLSQTPLLYGV